jgi:hypothetical protein
MELRANGCSRCATKIDFVPATLPETGSSNRAAQVNNDKMVGCNCFGCNLCCRLAFVEPQMLIRNKASQLAVELQDVSQECLYLLALSLAIASQGYFSVRADLYVYICIEPGTDLISYGLDQYPNLK